LRAGGDSFMTRMPLLEKRIITEMSQDSPKAMILFLLSG
jgi:hypothetical protein